MPLSFYKGYSAYELVDGKWIKFEALCQPTYKLVAIEAKEGIHTYKIKYTGTLVQHASLALSTLSWIGIIIYSKKKNCVKYEVRAFDNG